MSSIRPLVTITLLVVVGAILYVKINEGTIQPSSGANETWNQPVDGVPPLASANLAPAPAAGGSAPGWPATSTPPLATTPPAPAVSATTTAPAPAAVPAIPEIPEIGTTTTADAALTPQVSPPTTLPTNIPEARYQDQLPAAAAGAPMNTTLSAAPGTGIAPSTATPFTPAAQSATTTPFAATSADAPSTAVPSAATATTPEQMNAAAVAAGAAAMTPLASSANPLRQAAAGERYGNSAEAALAANTAPAPLTPVSPAPARKSFAESWPAIQAALDKGQLAEAHKELSSWYGDPSLTPTDAERIESLLSQLAGTVVYSTEHQLAPARVVKQGETLETIAKDYNVPWQLLGKINNVAAPDQLRPGQELKVMQGPFSAVVNTTRNELVLMVDGRYAGKFPVSVAPGQPLGEGQWVVDQKVGGTVGAAASAPQYSSGARAIVLHSDPAAPGAAAAGAPSLTIASAPPAAGAANAGATIQVSQQDAEDLSDILSIGSRVIIRR